MTVTLSATWRNYVELPAHPASASIARKHVAKVLTDWRREALIENAQLVASELVSNGIKAMGEDDHQVWIGLHWAPVGVVVEVWDYSPLPPKLRAPEAWETSGRGPQLVNAIAANWGYRWPRTGGKIVWAMLTEPS